jgi:hypothetical protein
MDVKEIQAGVLSAAAGKKGKKEELNGFEFQKMLQEAQGNMKEAPQAAPGGSVGGAEILAETVFPVNLLSGVAEPASLGSQGVLASEKVLDLLERYQGALSNPRISLKGVDPLVQALSREIQGLTEWAEKLSPSDPLRKIVSEIGTLSAVEVEKFRRGDYV